MYYSSNAEIFSKILGRGLGKNFLREPKIGIPSFRFHALGPIYYRDSHGAVLVYDITDEDSFEKVKNWVKELKKMLGDNIAITIVGNKIDLEKDRVVEVDVAEQYAKTVGAIHCHTSAKINKGIEELFLELSKRMMAKQAAEAADDEPSNGGGSGRGDRRSKNVIIVDDQDQPPRSGGCCNS